MTTLGDALSAAVRAPPGSPLESDCLSILLHAAQRPNSLRILVTLFASVPGAHAWLLRTVTTAVALESLSTGDAALPGSAPAAGASGLALAL